MFFGLELGLAITECIPAAGRDAQPTLREVEKVVKNISYFIQYCCFFMVWFF